MILVAERESAQVIRSKADWESGTAVFRRKQKQEWQA
jgi:hypothetical protein